MSIPTLIVGGDLEQRLAQIDLKPNPDLLVVEPLKSISIIAVRAVEKFLQRKPYEKPQKTVVITRADLLTLPAQQAFLKTLEEPPANSQIFLLAQIEDQLLETIVSRCLVKRLPDAQSPAGRLEKPAAEAYTDAEAAKKFIINQLHCCQHELRLHPETANVKLIKALNLAGKALNYNVNPKLTLDVLALSY